LKIPNVQKPLFLTPKQGFPSFFQTFRPQNRCFDSKTGNYFQTIFCKIFASLKRPDISEKIQNFGNRTIPKLAKTKSSENSVFCRA
jgi:hypothetical protein